MYVLKINIEQCPECNRYKGQVKEKYNGNVPVFCRCDLDKGKGREKTTCMIGMDYNKLYWKPVSCYKNENGEWLNVAHFAGPQNF